MGGGGRPGELVTGNPNLLLSKLLEQLLPQIKEDQDAVAELQRHVGEGCHLEGHMRVRRVAGNFHFALTHADHHVLMSVFHDRSHLNLSHTIHSISFGEIDAPAAKVMHSNPLDGRVKMLHQGSGFFQYYIKVVPTAYESLRGKRLETYQYSYTELFRTSGETDKMPAVYFLYDISPIMAELIQERRTLTSFLTHLCAIVGGVFTVAGMVDAAIFRTSKMMAAK